TEQRGRMERAGVTPAEGMKLSYGERVIDFSPPFERVSYGELFRKQVGVDMLDGEAVRGEARGGGLHEVEEKAIGVLVAELFDHLAEPALAEMRSGAERPVFLYDYPAALCPLTKRKAGDARIAERFELYVAGMELANAYTELNDPFVQEATFSAQLAGQK